MQQQKLVRYLQAQKTGGSDAAPVVVHERLVPRGVPPQTGNEGPSPRPLQR
jgi:glycerol-3-phosphate dehydrogenase